MPVRQDEKQDEKYNPAQDLYNQEFNSVAANYDKTADSSGEDANIAKAKGTHKDSHGDIVQNNPNADIEKTKDKEESGGLAQPSIGAGSKLGGLFKGKRAKKFGPSAGVAGLFIMIIGVGSAISIPAALLVMMERVFTNSGTHDVRANSMIAKGRFGGIFSTTGGDDKNCATSKIKCKVSSMSKKEIARWESKPGVKIDKGKTIFGRTVVRGMTVDIPNGKPLTITNSAQFKSALANNEHFRSLNYRVQHPRATFFIGPDSKFRSVLKKYKLNMGKTFSKVKAGSSKEERTKTFNADADRATGAPTEGDSKARTKARVDKAKERAKTLHAKFQGSIGVKAAKAVSSPAGWASLGCTLYSMQKATLATIKMSYYIDLIKFFHPFMKAAGQLVNEGDVDPELMDYIGDRLTWYQPESTADTADEKLKIDKTATDSQGFQAALYGDFGKLADFTKHYAPWWAISAASASGVIKEVEEQAGGKENIHKFCYVAKVASYAGFLNAGALGMLGGCIALNAIFDDYCNKRINDAFQWIIDQGMDGVYKRMESFVLDSSLKGVDLGNAIAAGVGLFLMEKNRGSGLKPATTAAAVTTYLSATEESYRQDLLAEKEDARRNPFDTSNQYSLASNVLMGISHYKSQETTGFSIAANFMSSMSNVFGGLTGSTAKAGYFQPIEAVDRAGSLGSMTKEGNKDGSGRKCEDQDMLDIGVLCDWKGASMDVVSAAPLQWAETMEDGDLTPWNETVDYMQTNGYLEDTSKDPEQSGIPKDYSEYNANPDPENYKEKIYKNEYLMYKAYCTNDRVYPLGTTMTPIDDGDANEENMGWLLGSKCAGNSSGGEPLGKDFAEKIDRFFFYYNMCETQIGIADENQKCWEDEKASDTTQTSSAGGSLKSDGEWGCPVDFGKGGVMTQQPHDIGNGTSSGVDYNYGKDTPGPIYAVRDGTVTQAGPASGYGNWVMIEHEENGKKISSYYGHIANGGYFVKVGDKVTKGQHIADIGAGIVGSSTGAHVHAGLKMEPQATAADYESRFMAACKK